MRSPEYDPRPVDPPAGPLTPILLATQTLPCIDQQCIRPIVPGDPMILLPDGWTHALHVEEG